MCLYIDRRGGLYRPSQTSILVGLHIVKTDGLYREIKLKDEDIARLSYVKLKFHGRSHLLYRTTGTVPAKLVS